MKHLTTIFAYSWILLKRNAILLIFLLVITISSIYAFYYSTKLTNKQLSVIAKVKETERQNTAEFNTYLQLDTTILSNKEVYKDKTSPFAADALLSKSVIFYPSGLSSMAIGQKDVFTFYRKTGGRSLYYTGGTITTNSSFQEIRNPEKLLAGNFDFSFVVIYLLPLLIIAFCYNLLSEEKELGTLPILTVTGLSEKQIALYRLFFYFVVTTVFITVVHIAGGIICIKNWQGEFISFLLFWVGILANIIFWFGCCFLFISLRQNSAVTALMLLGCWSTVVLVIPSSINSIVNIKNPVHSSADLSKTLQVNNGIIWNKLKDDTAFFHSAVKELKLKHPEFTEVHFDDTLNRKNEERLVLWHVMFDKLAKPDIDIYETSLLKRDKAAEKFDFFNPTGIVQNYLCNIAGTDKAAYNKYKETIAKTQHRFQKELFAAALMLNKHNQNLANSYKTVDNQNFALLKQASILKILLLLLIGLGIFIIGLNKIKKTRR